MRLPRFLMTYRALHRRDRAMYVFHLSHDGMTFRRDATITRIGRNYSQQNNADEQKDRKVKPVHDNSRELSSLHRSYLPRKTTTDDGFFSRHKSEGRKGRD